MAGVFPHWIAGEVKILLQDEAYVRVPNGNVYTLHRTTPGINFSQLRVGLIIEIEITDRLDRVYSARIISNAAECDGSTGVS